MKKINIIVLILLAVLLLCSCSGSFIPKDFYQSAKTGGALEAKYMEYGSYSVSKYEEAALQGFEKYIICYPSELESTDKRYPAIVISNGTGWKVSKNLPLLEHLASWGFVVIGTEEEYDWNGFSSEMCLRHLLRLNEVDIVNDKPNVFKGKIDFENIGISGHSQGGVGVFNAITSWEHSYMFKAAVAISPTNLALAEALEWHYDPTLIDTPILLISGAGGGDDWVITGEQLTELYNSICCEKIMMRRVDTDHGKTLYAGDGYVTAFFMYHLQGDAEAGKAFLGDDAEILNNPLWQDVYKNK